MMQGNHIKKRYKEKPVSSDILLKIPARCNSKLLL